MADSKHILVLSTAYLPFIGGAEIAVKEITDRLGDEIGFDLITAKLKRGLPSVEKIGKVTVYRIGIGIPLVDKFFLPYFGANKIKKLNKERKYDFFWCIMASFSSGSAYIYNFFRRLGGKKRIPIILTLQEGDSEKYLKSKWLGLVNLSWRMALRRTDILTAISRYLLERAKRLGFQGKSFIIPNGVNGRLFSESLDSRTEAKLKEKLGKKDKEIFLITTSRLTPKNGIEDIIKALTKLPQFIKLLIIGTGSLEKRLREQTKNLKLEERVKFLGLLPNEKIPAYLHISDIFVRPSLSEGMGNSFIEAMAAGLPVIATPVGGITDFLFDPDKNPDVLPTGLFCKVHDPDSIANCVIRLLDDLTLREQIIKNGRLLALEKYDWDLVAKKMKEKVFDTPKN